MIVLDTNIIAELMKTEPNEKVVEWLKTQKVADLYTTAITTAEINYGLAALPAGKRRNKLEAAFSKCLEKVFFKKILHFDEISAENYGKIMASCRTKGKPMSICDGQIAATTIANGGILVTRNTKDFANTGLTLINPFT